MGCGVSILGATRDLQLPSVTNLRAFSSICQDESRATGNFRILQEKTQSLKDVYSVGRVLGKGQFGTCRLVMEKSTRNKYACKSISKRRLACMGDVLDVRREVEIMFHLAGHPNIVNIKEVLEDRGHVHLVAELCTGGELFDSIFERGRYSERDAAAAFRCIAIVVAHCHNMGVMHRDIKPENFLLSRPGLNAPIKGTDFGLSCFFTEGQVFKDVVGSAYYVAPEVLRRRYDKRADIWSLGVLLYILLSGTPPFFAETERGIFQAILHDGVSFEAEPWPSISEGAKDVILSMLTRNPAQRATAAEVLQHEWVRKDGTAGTTPLNNEVLQRLQNFAALNKLQQEALKVIATHLPETEITGLRALFTEMDADGSGSITVDELRKALQRKGTRIPLEELQRIMAQADISGDGTLDYGEFLAATMSLAKLEHEEHLYMAFRFFDTDDSGFITREELGVALEKVCSVEEINELMRQADRSGDGRIDYEEFCDLMRSGKPGLAMATKTVKRGLMRSAHTQSVLDLPKLSVESVTRLDYLTGANRLPPINSTNGDNGSNGDGSNNTSDVIKSMSAAGRNSNTGRASSSSKSGGSSSKDQAAADRVSFTLHAQPRRLQPSISKPAASQCRRDSGPEVLAYAAEMLDTALTVVTALDGTPPAPGTPPTAAEPPLAAAATATTPPPPSLALMQAVSFRSTLGG